MIRDRKRGRAIAGAAPFISCDARTYCVMIRRCSSRFSAQLDSS